MSDEHEHHHEHDHGQAAPVTPDDAGSQALAEALRSSFAIVKVVMLLMVLAFFGSGFFQVGPQEKAVVLRLGRPVGEGKNILLGPGLHWSFPYPIDEVVKIPITEQQIVQSTVGWYFTTPEQELSGEELPAGPTLNPAVDGYVITADRNILHARATLYYQIDDPMRAVFGFSSGTNLTYGLAGVSNAVQNALNNALVYSAAHFKVDDILYNEFGAFQDAVEERTAELVAQEDLGITINQCSVDKKMPPRQLADIFAQVTIARENRIKALQDAVSYENQVTNAASAQATTIIATAEAARNRYVESLSAEAKRFSDLLPQYESNPSLFAQQTLVPVMGQVLTNVDKWFIPENLGSQPPEVRLMLNREPPEPKTGAANP